jgi:hypothetical protein
MRSRGTGKTHEDSGLKYLLELDGNIEVQNDAGYWIKIEVCRVSASPDRPHGIKYSLTLHSPEGDRLIGFDNPHAVKSSRSKHAGKRYPYDHRHRHSSDEGVLYEFQSAYQLLSDFYEEVDRVLKEVSE